VIRWLGERKGDLIFWICAAMVIANVIETLTCPEELQARYFTAGIVFAVIAVFVSLAGADYEPEDDDY
jgi:hypothetical protein